MPASRNDATTRPAVPADDETGRPAEMAAATSASPRPSTMRAAMFDRYGPPEVVEVTTVPVPALDADQVLVRVEAAGINPYDWHHYRGEPLLFVRPAKGILRPRAPITIGADVAGVVEQVGAAVSGLSEGDRVYGEVGFGTCADRVVVAADRVTPMPTNLTSVEAAGLPMGSLTALQALRNGGITEGSKVLVNGASGGVGHQAVQLARALGAAHVTGVCSTRNVDMVRDLGADRVIDYTREDLTIARGHDLLMDTVGNHSTRTFSRMLARDGCLVVVGGGRGRWVEPGGQVLRAVVQSPFVSARVAPVFSVDNSSAALATITEFVEAGSVRPVIEASYPLDEIHAALRHLETGHVRGKLVITP